MSNLKIKVPLLDLKKQYDTIKDGLKKEVEEVLDSQIYILGPKVEMFEKNVAEYCNTKYAIGVSSGTDALSMSLLALGIKEGDEVILSPFTFFATGGIVHWAKAKLVFVDIDPVTFNIDADKIEEVITPKTKAIIPIHLFGQCAEIDKIVDIAKKHKISILEDAAQAIGSDYKGRRAGSFGDVGAFSCYPSKNLGAVGEAGFITTNSDTLHEKLVIIRNQGQSDKYFHKFVGGNFRMDGIQGAVLNYKLKFLDKWTEKRRQNAKFITNLIKEKTLDEFIIAPKIVYERHIFNQYTIRVKNGKRDALKSYLAESDIGTAIYYPVPLHNQPCFDYLGYKKGDFPESEKACDEVLSLPIYPELTEEMMTYVVDKIEEYFKK